VLDHNLRVKTTNRAFCRIFQVSPDETIGRFLFDLGTGQWSGRTLRSKLEDALKDIHELEHFVVEHDFPTIGLKRIALSARLIEERDGRKRPRLLLMSMEDVTAGGERSETSREQTESNMAPDP
jgi:two-component system CheB/CheR fusion protein